MITDISHLTPTHVDKYLKHINPNLMCPICQQTNHFAPMVDDSREDEAPRLVFTALVAYDSSGNLDSQLGSVPTIPCVCNHCGYSISFLAVQILNFVQNGDLNEE